MNVDNEKIGKNIIALLKKRNETPSQLASALNVTRSTVSKWVNGTNNIPLDSICSIAEHLECSLDYLVYGTVEKISPDFMKIGLDYEVQEFYKRIKDKKTGTISWTDAMNFLITSDLLPGYDEKEYQENDITNSIDDRFIKAWATYLYIDIKDIPHDELTPILEIDDTYRKLKHTIGYASLETFQLCYLMDLLKEKKQQFMKTSRFKEIHRKNQTREYLAEEEKWADQKGKEPYIRPSYQHGYDL